MTGLIFNVRRYGLDDGPGIRTTIFLKGCPLSCLWCSNPESQKPYPELMYDSELHIEACEQCIEVCPVGAISKDEDRGIKIQRDRCISGCYACAKVCYSKALEVVGQEVSVEHILSAVKKDMPFYQSSGGGVTLSGGEPLAQPEFSKEVLRGCKQMGLHTVLDTSGYGRWEDVERIINYVDLLHYDIKHMDPHAHKMLTGVDNALILNNARRVSQHGISIFIRFPVVPGINDSRKNLDALINLAKEISAAKVDLLPYHRLGVPKYRVLGREFKLEAVEPPTRESINFIHDLLVSRGLKVEVVT